MLTYDEYERVKPERMKILRALCKDGPCFHHSVRERRREKGDPEGKKKDDFCSYVGGGLGLHLDCVLGTLLNDNGQFLFTEICPHHYPRQPR